MELKKYDEYTDREKKELLFHWWQYYGKTVCSLGVMRCFIQMVDNDVDEKDIFPIARINLEKKSLLMLDKDLATRVFNAPVIG